MKTTTGQTGVPIELSFTAAGRYADPFHEAELDVVFAGPGGRRWRVPGFWRGGRRFAARFAAPAPGRYAWRSESSNPGDAGLHGVSGEFRATAYTGKNPLLRRGRFQVARGARHLEHADGTPFLWTADTWWNGFTTRLDWPAGFKALAADRVAKGFNVIQIVAGPLPDWDAVKDSWHPLQANENGWSWEKKWARINPAFFDAVDRKVAHLVGSGLAPCLVGMWGYYLPFMGVERVKKHWRYLVARYGAWPIFWCLAGEVAMMNMTLPEHVPDLLDRERTLSLQLTGWREVSDYVRKLDPFRNPITVHPCHHSRKDLRFGGALDFEMLQTGHSGYQSLENSVDTMVRCLALKPRMPVLNAEVCYEGIMGSSWQEVQRFLFWTNLLFGAAGHTYGAQGIWNMNSANEPYAGAWTGSWGDQTWQEAMHFPGSAHVGLARRFLERYPWWRFQPRPEPALDASVSPYSFAAGIPKTIALYYLPGTNFPARLRGAQGGAFRGAFSLTLERGVRYRAFYFNPRTGQERRLGEARAGSDGRWKAPTKPSMEDWVLALENPAALKRVSARG